MLIAKWQKKELNFYVETKTQTLFFQYQFTDYQDSNPKLYLRILNPKSLQDSNTYSTDLKILFSTQIAFLSPKIKPKRKD